MGVTRLRNVWIHVKELQLMMKKRGRECVVTRCWWMFWAMDACDEMWRSALIVWSWEYAYGAHALMYFLQFTIWLCHHPPQSTHFHCHIPLFSIVKLHVPFSHRHFDPHASLWCWSRRERLLLVWNVWNGMVGILINIFLYFDVFKIYLLFTHRTAA